MVKIAIPIAAMLLCGSAAFAQPTGRWYASGATSALRVNADDVDSGGTSSVGVGVGFRVTPTFSIEFEVERGLGKLSRTYSGKFVSFAGPNATREEIERLGVTMQSDTRWTPQLGWSVLAVVQSNQAARAGIAVFGGVTASRYDVRRTLTVIDIPAGVDRSEADLHRMLPDEHFSRTRGGLTGGLRVPMRVTSHLSVAPELRFTYGSFGDEVYTVVRGGARVTWNF